MELMLKDCMSADEIYQILDQCSTATLEELKDLGLREGMSQEDLIQMCSLTSDRAYNELVGMNIFGPVLTADQIMQMCSGTDKEGFPNSFGVLSIDTITEDMGTVTYASVALGSPVINLYGAGGCVVVTADFQSANMFEFRRARDILTEWIERKNEPDFLNRILSLTISPVLLEGRLMTIYHDIVYAQGVPVDERTHRLIMAFDNTQTQEVIDSDINLHELKTAVESEIARQEAEARAALIEAEKEVAEEEASEYNPYEEAVVREYLQDNELNLPEDHKNSGDDDEDEDKSNFEWMRISRD